MPHYQDPAGGLHFLDLPQFQYLLPAGSVEVSEDHAATVRAKLLAEAIARQPVEAPAAVEPDDGREWPDSTY